MPRGRNPLVARVRRMFDVITSMFSKIYDDRRMNYNLVESAIVLGSDDDCFHASII